MVAEFMFADEIAQIKVREKKSETRTALTKVWRNDEEGTLKIIREAG